MSAFKLPAGVIKTFKDIQLNLEAVASALNRLTVDDDVWGLVNADATIRSGTGFSTSKNGTGDYTISFAKAFRDAPAVTLAAELGSGTIIRLVGAPVAGSFRVKNVDTAGVASDAFFSFIARGTA